VDLIRRYLRMLRIQLAARRGPKLGLHDVAIRRERVWLTDIDELRHMNNSVYLGLLDHARLDLLLRSGAWKLMRHAGVYPVVTMQTISYRKSLELGDRYEIQTRIAGYDERQVYIEQRFVRDGEVTAVAFIAGRFLRDRAVAGRSGVVTMAELGEVTGVDVSALGIPDWMADWAAATRLPSTREAAPSIWKPLP
jgi:YbgC/YbaW family acyl-CoA thioester hydrolase